MKILGIIWEKWFIDQLKGAGVLIDSNLKFADGDRWISGEVDAVIRNPETDGKIIIEYKTFYGYNAKRELCGNRTVKPKPKEGHLLQAFLYADQFKDQVECVILTYFARDDHTRQEFRLDMHEEGGRHYPMISTTHLGSFYQYVEKRISIEGIYENFENLMTHLKEDRLPAPSYKHNYSDEEIRLGAENGTIAKTTYEKYIRNPKLNPIGYFMCRSYCQFRSMCKAQKDKDGDQ